MTILQSILSLALTAAPWLVLGLLVAGLIKSVLSDTLLRRWVGGRGLAGIARAAMIGAPLPLCSCGAIPTALALYRKGAGRGPASAFLIGTPGIGVDSVAITYALLGPFMALTRALGAVVTAIGTGLLVATTGGKSRTPSSGVSSPRTGSCSQDACGDRATEPAQAGLFARMRDSMRYAFSDLLDDISLWILVGLIIAGALIALVPPQTLAAHGSGITAILLFTAIRPLRVTMGRLLPQLTRP